ncbi:hypothetical protein GY45DRAFT_1366563 [Cubamyces sp. BRFM 1775]|nr:hypothetical protein GY45DRAFT_1366563 [Cubamyces sp. BRFM 1775]
MASGARRRKSSSAPAVDISDLNNVERLIFAQAVHEFGATAWPEVAKLLSNHPLISQPKGTFTPQSCPTLHRLLMEDAGLEWSESDIGPRSEKHLKLAQRYYVARVTELRELIAAEETKFKTLVTEIDEIRSGAWDDKIRASVGIVSEHEQETQTKEVEDAAKHEHIDADEPTGASREEAIVVEPQPAVENAEAEAEEPDDAIDRGAEAGEEEAVIDTEKEEGSDNEAVDELIGNFSSEKPPPSQQEEEPPAAPDEDVVQEEKPEMEVDEAEEEVDAEAQATPQPADSSPDDEALQEPDSPEVPISVAQEAAFASRAEGKRKASDADTYMLDAQRERKRAREESEPADEDDIPPKMRRKSDAPVVSKRFQNVIGMLHSQISQHRYGNIFHNPIKKTEAPDYHDIVKRPMDLKTIKSRVKDGLISNSLEFQRDIYLMFANAMMYNRPGSEIYNMAEEMMLSSEREINAFRQTEGFHRM